MNVRYTRVSGGVFNADDIAGSQPQVGIAVVLRLADADPDQHGLFAAGEVPDDHHRVGQLGRALAGQGQRVEHLKVLVGRQAVFTRLGHQADDIDRLGRPTTDHHDVAVADRVVSIPFRGSL